ncbi:hypothetical protein AB0H28_18945 [Micromonospora sp. NPDC050980]|uniref:hypothetical protein n=1 Tax=Micromonospora sp. NPDC050980 TaxID=3155161 RepID=UPI0033E33D95
MPDLRERLKAGAALGRFVGTVKGRQYMRENGYRPDWKIVVALPDDPIRDVLDRAQVYQPPVVLAVWFEDKGRFGFCNVVPNKEVTPGSGDQFGGTATVGMLLALLDEQTKGELSFGLKDWSGFGARGFSPSLLNAV